MEASPVFLCLLLLPLMYTMIGNPIASALSSDQRRDDMFLDDNSTATDIFRHILRKNNRGLKARPNEAKGIPDTVNVSMYIESVRAISEVDMEISYDMYLRFHWVDHRITFDAGPDTIVLSPEIAQPHLWFPDLFFVSSHDVMLHKTLDSNSGIWIMNTGEVRVSVRMTIVAHCDMDLRHFPHDVQTCGLTIESYMYNKEQIDIQWKAFSMSPTTNPVNFKLEGSDYGLKMLVLGDPHKEYPRAYVNLTMRRISAHYILLVYLPSILLVVLGSLIFWLPTPALLERSLFGMFLIFCMTIIMVGSQYGSPVVGYVKAIDVWVVSCFFFLVVALLEVLLFYLVFGREILSRAGTGDQFQLMSDDESSNKPAGSITIGPWLTRPDVAHKIDLALRIIYPSAFVVFNAIYWASNA